MFKQGWNLARDTAKSVYRKSVDIIDNNTGMVVGTVGTAVATTTGNAMAAAPDVTAVVTEIGGAATPIASIGAAVLLVIVGIKVFKWVRRAM
jgi:hypothetical protein